MENRRKQARETWTSPHPGFAHEKLTANPIHSNSRKHLQRILCKERPTSTVQPASSSSSLPYASSAVRGHPLVQFFPLYIDRSPPSSSSPPMHPIPILQGLQWLGRTGHREVPGAALAHRVDRRLPQTPQTMLQGASTPRHVAAAAWRIGRGALDPEGWTEVKWSKRRIKVEAKTSHPRRRIAGHRPFGPCQ